MEQFDWKKQYFCSVADAIKEKNWNYANKNSIKIMFPFLSIPQFYIHFSLSIGISSDKVTTKI